MNPASITRRTRRDSLDLGFSVIQQTLDIVVGTGGIGGQGVDGGGDVAEAALEPAIPMKDLLVFSPILAISGRSESSSAVTVVLFGG